MQVQRCARCHHRPCFTEGTAPNDLGLRRQAAALRVREAEPARGKVFTKDAILCLEIIDDVPLLLVDPAGDGDDKELQRLRTLTHTS